MTQVHEQGRDARSGGRRHPTTCPCRCGRGHTTTKTMQNTELSQGGHFIVSETCVRCERPHITPNTVCLEVGRVGKRRASMYVCVCVRVPVRLQVCLSCLLVLSACLVCLSVYLLLSPPVHFIPSERPLVATTASHSPSHHCRTPDHTPTPTNHATSPAPPPTYGWSQTSQRKRALPGCVRVSSHRCKHVGCQAVSCTRTPPPAARTPGDTYLQKRPLPRATLMSTGTRRTRVGPGSCDAQGGGTCRQSQ